MPTRESIISVHVNETGFYSEWREDIENAYDADPVPFQRSVPLLIQRLMYWAKITDRVCLRITHGSDRVTVQGNACLQGNRVLPFNAVVEFDNESLTNEEYNAAVHAADDKAHARAMFMFLDLCPRLTPAMLHLYTKHLPGQSQLEFGSWYEYHAKVAIMFRDQLNMVPASSHGIHEMTTHGYGPIDFNGFFFFPLPDTEW